MRQAGIIAAAGLYAMEHHIDRLADDHANATRLANGLAKIEKLDVTACNTNMVFSHVTDSPPDLAKLVGADGVLIPEGPNLRLVTHLDISTEDVDTCIEVLAHHLR